MPKVTVTFQEEGDAEAAFELPAWAVDALQHFVDDPSTEYHSKMELFSKWAMRDLVTPLCQRYGCYPPEVLALIQAAEAAKATAQAAITAALASVINVPSAPEPE